MNANIVTLTMYPALKMSAEVHRVVPESKLRCQRPRFDTGGGGINVARVVTKLGGEAEVPCHAIVDVYLCNESPRLDWL